MIAQQGQAFGIELVNPARAFATIAHQARFLEHAKVLGDGGAGDREARGNLVHRERLVAQHLEDGQPGVIAQSSQSALYVSVHLR